MRKRVILALMLVLALAVTTSCSLIVKDAEVDKQTVIIEVAGKTYTKGEVQEQVTQSLNYQQYMYSMYGMSFDPTDSAMIADARTSVVDSLIEEAVVNQKKEEMGMNAFTDEELAEMQTSVDESYQSYKDGVKSSEFADTELTGDALDQAIEAKMTEMGYSTKEQLLDYQKSSKASEKLKAEVVKDVAISEEEIKAAYDTRVESAKAEYAQTPAAYGTAVENGQTTYYTPAGYRYVKNILRKFSEEDSTKISDFETQISEKQTQLTNVETSLADLGEDTGADDEATAKNRADLTATKATLDTDIAELQKQLDAAKEAAYATLQPTVDEILTKLAAGGDFDALMAEYGEDTGMQASPAKETGYLVCESSTNWATEFTAASMALEKIGDVSPAVRTSFGIHLIQYASDAAEGPATYDSVKDAIQSELLSTKQDELYTQTVAQWVKDAGAKTWLERLAD